MRHVVADHLVQTQGARDAVDDRQHVRAEAGLQLRVLVEVVEHDLRDGVTLDDDDDAHAHAVGRLVLDLGDAGDLAVAHLLGDRGDQMCRVDLVRQLGDDDLGGAAIGLLDLDDTAHADRPASGAVGVLDALAADDEAGGREVRSLDPFHDGLEGGFLVGLVVVERPVDGLGDLAQVVRRDVGGHTDGDAAGTVDEQVRDPARQDRRLLRLAVVVRDEIDCVVVDLADHLHGQRRHPALGVTHRGRAVVAAGTEVALAVDERVAQRPRLRHAHEGVVDGAVAVRVVVTHGVGDRARGLHVSTVRTVTVVVHRVQHAAVHRLEAVAHVGQRAAHDHAHRVIDVAGLHLLLDVDRFDPVVRRFLGGQRRVGHELTFW